MATTIDQALKNIAALSDASADKVDRLSRSITSLNAVTKNAKTAEEVLALKKLTQGLQNLLTVEKEYIDINKKIEKAKENNQEINAKDLKQAKNITKQRQHDVIVVKQWGREVAKVYKNAGEYADKYEADALRNFKTNTLVGKSFDLLGSQVLSFGGKLGFASLSWKAWGKHLETAEISQNILIQSFGDLENQTKGTISTFPILGKSFEIVSGKTVGYVLNLKELNESLSRSKAVAVSMGVSTEVVGDAFLKFSRIVGTKTPKSLESLTSASIAVSRSLGISVPEAVDFVSLRMDKFGGSAASAIASLANMRDESERINKSFGRTVIRGDDVARTLLDISKQTTMYAIDQRLVGGVLRDNIAKLQATGSSYEQAAKKAQAYTEAVTGKAPEWMKVFSAQDIYSQIADISPEKFVSQFGAELEAAKPGLTNEVQSILNDKSMAKYSKMMLLQEMLSGTSVGIDSMNKQILKLANHPQGVVLIAKQFGVSLSEAQGMVDQAKTMEERTKIINSLMNEGLDTTNKKLTLNKKDFQLSQDQQKEIKDAGEAAVNAAKLEAQQRGKVASDLDIVLAKKSAEKAAINSIIDAKNEEASVDADLKRLANEEMLNKKAMMKVEGQLAILQKKKADLAQKLAAATDDKTRKELESEMKRINKRISETELEKTRYESKDAEKKGLSAGLKTNEEITAKLLDKFGDYSDVTFKSFASFFEKHSTITNTLLVGLGSGLLFLGNKLTGASGKLTKWLAEKYAAGWKTGLAPTNKTLKKIEKNTQGGGGDDGGGGLGGEGKGKRKKGKKATKRRGKGKRLKLPKKVPKIPPKKPRMGGGKLGTILGLTSAAIAGYGLMGSGEAKAAEVEQPDNEDTKKESPRVETGTSKAVNTGANVAAGGAAAAAVGVGGMKLAKLLKGGTKGLKALKGVPLVGSAIAGGFAAVQAYDLYKKWKQDPNSITASDKIKMVSDLASMIPGIGTAVAMVDIGAEATGVYAKIDELSKGKVPALPPITPTDPTAPKISTLSQIGIAPGASEALKPTTPDVATPGSAPIAETATADTGSSGSPSGSFVGGPNADGSITLRVDNFMGAFSKAQAMTKQKGKFS